MATVQQMAPQPVIRQAQTDCCCNATGDVTQSKQTMRGVAIAETVLGALIFLFGAILASIESLASSISYRLYTNSYYGSSVGYTSYYYRYPFTTGEGIWCGLFIIVAGATGILAAKSHSTSCMIKAHMVLSILAAVMSFPLFCLAVSSTTNYPLLRFIILNSLNIIFALACLGMYIRSAHLCCLCITGCCCVSDPQPFTQVVYATQQPGVLQSAGPGYVVQGYPPQVQGQGAIAAQQPVGPFQSTQINPGCVQQAIPQNQGYTAQVPE